MAAVKRTPRPTTSKSGTTLDGDTDRALLTEAEAGFDAATLVPRRAGRPSKSGKPARPMDPAREIENWRAEAALFLLSRRG